MLVETNQEIKCYVRTQTGHISDVMSGAGNDRLNRIIKFKFKFFIACNLVYKLLCIGEKNSEQQISHIAKTYIIDIAYISSIKQNNIKVKYTIIIYIL